MFGISLLWTAGRPCSVQKHQSAPVIGVCFRFSLMVSVRSHNRLVMAALCNRGAIIFLPCGYYLSFYLSFFPRLISEPEIGCLPYFHTWCGLSANLECMSEMCGTRLAANTGRKKAPFWRHRTTLSGCIFATKARIDNWKKNLFSSNISSTYPHNMANFGLLTAEICWRVWGTPANFNGFRVLAASLHGTLIVGVSQTAALNRGRHL